VLDERRVYTDGASAEANPYVSARREWNDHVGSLVSAKQMWQYIALLMALLALAAIGGVIHIGSQSKIVPHVVVVDQLGRTVASGVVKASSVLDPRILEATVGDFIANARTVTPDVELQKLAILRVYAHLSTGDPAYAKMGEWMNPVEGKTPFERAADEMVGTEIRSIIPQTADSYQVEWVETVRERSGVRTGDSITYKAIVTVYTAETGHSPEGEEQRLNALGIYVRDFSWTRVLGD